MTGDKKNFFSDNEDLMFHFENSLEWASIIELTEGAWATPDGYKNVEEAMEVYREIMEQVGHYAGHEIAPRAEALDRNGARLEGGKVVMPPELDQIFDGFREMELFGLTVPRHLGGLNAAMALSFILNEVIGRADVSVMTHFGFHGPIAMALLVYSAREGSMQAGPGGWIGPSRFDDAVRSIVAGRAWGTMELTEPWAGSDLAAIRTTGRRGPDGKWRISGQKSFITSGHGQYHLVLAKTEESALGAAEAAGEESSPMAGLAALSLFLVPAKVDKDGQQVDNVRLERVEEKLGHHASPTCALVYEEAEAELIGRPGQGFELMLVMMNGARLAVGFEAIGVSQAAFEMAKEYAAQRQSMGRPIAEHELIADKLLRMETDIRGLRAMAFEALNAVELSHKLELTLKYAFVGSSEQRHAAEERLEGYKRRARELTPLLKYLAAEKAVEICRDNMQIHGGYGYMKDYGAEKLLRDALVIPVYEGTSQIQALMALKDHLQFALKDPLTFVKNLGASRLKALTSRGVHKLYWECVYEKHRSMEHIVREVLKGKIADEWAGMREMNPLELWKHVSHDFLRRWDAREDFAYGLLHAERMAEILTHCAIAEILLRQAEKHPERKVWAERYVKRMHARVVALSTAIRSGDREVLDWIEEKRSGRPSDRQA
jgi:alkylation response protein AidB-like acyl-CoA dehydrogenase